MLRGGGRYDELMGRFRRDAPAVALSLSHEALLEAIARGAPLQEIRALVYCEGFTTVRADGIAKGRAGLTTPEEVLCVTRQ